MRTGIRGAKSIQLENQLCSGLENARIEGTLILTEVACALVHADAAAMVVTWELRVVPGVEALRTELEATPAILADDEALEEREIPVVPARTAHDIVPEIAIAVGASCAHPSLSYGHSKFQ